MAFNFAGKIKSKKDWDEFEEFFRKEIALANKKTLHLTAEITRLGTLLDNFKHADIALRAGYSLSEAPDLKYLQKARQQDELPTNTLDTVTAMDVAILKKPILDAIKAKRERNEWKIKRIRDLIEQYNNEIANINNVVTVYEDVLNRVTSRFKNTDFTEVQEIKKQDETEIDPSKLAVRKSGKITVKDVTCYTVSNIAADNNIITFEGTAPPVAIGGILVLSGGLNDGEKTVQELISYRQLKVVETLISENPTNTVILIKS